MTQKEKQERLTRTVFVGNVPIAIKKKKITKEFQVYGEIEKVWMRSVSVVPSKSLSVKARVILQHYNNDQLTKNCYILFKEENSAAKALAHNSKIVWG